MKAYVAIVMRQECLVPLNAEEAFLLQAKDLNGTLAMALDALVDRIYCECAKQTGEEVDFELQVVNDDNTPLPAN